MSIAWRSKDLFSLIRMIWTLIIKFKNKARSTENSETFVEVNIRYINNKLRGKEL